MGFIFVSARGIDKDSRQNLLLNEFDPKKKFYKIADIEYLMGFMTRKAKNLYLIGIFSLGRRVFDPLKHTGFLTKQEAALRRQYFNSINPKMYKIAESSKEVEVKPLANEQKQEETKQITGEQQAKTTTKGTGLALSKPLNKKKDVPTDKYDDKILKLTLIFCCRK